MDGETYPARLVDLPCILETQKTLDRNTYFKSGDVGQMLIVYEDERAFTKDEPNCSMGPWGYYSDGITPPTKNIVRRRFLKARHPSTHDRAEVSKVETQVIRMMESGGRVDKGAGAGGAEEGGGGGGGGG
ncbi:unnamed protein product, partial [Choristocarpus tenellus]